MASEERRVLSVQSHVVHGYVGNKSATFPLQVLGFEVDAINSVQFSNHTGYATVEGQVLHEQELATLINGLEANGLLKSYTHLLTGYTGNASFLRELAQILKKLREANPELIYVCDPVMGDDGRMYVPENLLPIFRDEIIPLADIVTPNQYEVELLTGTPISSEEDVWQAVEWFHERGVKLVVISSSDLAAKDGQLRAFLSQRNGPSWVLNIPKQGDGIATFTGTGDLFAALFLAHSYQTDDYAGALERTVASLQAVIRRTILHMPKDVLDGKRKVTAHERELRLVQSKQDIEQPEVLHHATMRQCQKK